MKAAVGAFDAQVLHLADEAQIGVAHQDPRQQAAFAKDLKAVANAKDQAAALGMGADAVHDGGAAGDRSAAQVVAIAEAARQNDEIGAFR